MIERTMAQGRAIGALISVVQIVSIFALFSISTNCAFCSSPQISAINVFCKGNIPQYSLWETSFNVAGSYTNPYDPSQIDVEAHVQAPSGRTFDVPGFWYQDFKEQAITGAPLQDVQFFKVYMVETQWAPGTNVNVGLAAPSLIDNQGVEHPVVTSGGNNPINWQSTGDGSVTWPSGFNESGTPAAQLSMTATSTESYPGAYISPVPADIRGYKGFSIWVYPTNVNPNAVFYLYYHDQTYGDAPGGTWAFDGKGLIPNQWNKLTWYWPIPRAPVTLTPNGSPQWRVRFSPTEVGKYTVTLNANASGSTASAPPISVTTIASTSPGFVRVSKTDPRYFAFDNGSSFFPIGHDVAWSLQNVRALYPKMHQAGENATYFIMTPWDEAFEWAKLGSYDQNRAAQFDRVVEAAEQNDIYLKLSIDLQDAFVPGQYWETNPYNAANGGPCVGVNDFYTNPTARTYYQNRLRYIVARWGYSTHIMAFEPVAEIDGATQLNGQAGWSYPTQSAGQAISTMLQGFLTNTGTYLKSIDPNQRLFTIEFSGNVSDEAIWHLPIIDYTQLHTYEDADPGQLIADFAQEESSTFGKPMQVSEYGSGDAGPTGNYDPAGTILHDGMWAAAFSGSAGGALDWWQDMIDEDNFYPQYAALQSITKQVNWPGQSFTSAIATVSAPSPTAHGFTSVIKGYGGFSGVASDTYTLNANGTIQGSNIPPEFLMGRARSEPHIIPKFNVNFAVPGQFTADVNTVALPSQMTVYIDGNPAQTVALPVQNVPNGNTIWDSTYSLFKCIYNQQFSVNVPAGQHQISIENSDPGFSWIQLNGYQFQVGTAPVIKPFGVTGLSNTLMWFWNTTSQWNLPPPGTLTGASTVLYSLPSGQYYANWIDPWSGNYLVKTRIVVGTNPVSLGIPTFSRDIALQLQKYK